MTPKRLLAGILVLALGWSLYWAWHAWSAQRGLTGWMEARRAAGWVAEWSDISVAGFPNRIDRTIEGLSLADPEGGWSWEAPFVQILGLVYRDDRVILIWPPEQRLTTPWQKMVLTGEELRGSLTLKPGPAQEVETAVLVFRGLALTSDAGWRLAAEEARLAARPTAGRAGWVDLGLEAVGLEPPARLVRMLSEADLAPERFERLSADVAVRLDAALDRAALETRRPQPVALEIREIRAVWGELDLAVAGDLEIDAEGRPTGSVQVKARNWRDMLAVAVEGGLLPEGLARTLERGLEAVSGLAGSPETLDVPLRFRGGLTFLGPVPVGPAPRLHLP